MMEYMEYSKIRNIRNTLKHGIYRTFCIFDFNWTDKKPEAKNTRLFSNIKNSIFVLPYTLCPFNMTVLKALLLTGEGSCIGF